VTNCTATRLTCTGVPAWRQLAPLSSDSSTMPRSPTATSALAGLRQRQHDGAAGLGGLDRGRGQYRRHHTGRRLCAAQPSDSVAPASATSTPRKAVKAIAAHQREPWLASSSGPK
jgi:hypothetical protein